MSLKLLTEMRWVEKFNSPTASRCEVDLDQGKSHEGSLDFMPPDFPGGSMTLL